MHRVFNIFLLIIIILFFSNIFTYYTSSKNIENVKINRFNIEDTLKEKSLGLPVLNNDTNNVIDFNSSYDEEIKDNKPRKFWNLLKVE